MHGSRGCLGCYDKPKPVTSLDHQPNGLSAVGQSGKKPSISEDLWTASTCDMDNSAVQSQGSISSISVFNHSFDPHGLSGSSSYPSEFVNHGLLLWNQMRQNWVGTKKLGNQAQHPQEAKLKPEVPLLPGDLRHNCSREKLRHHPPTHPFRLEHVIPT